MSSTIAEGFFWFLLVASALLFLVFAARSGWLSLKWWKQRLAERKAWKDALRSSWVSRHQPEICLVILFLAAELSFVGNILQFHPSVAFLSLPLLVGAAALALGVAVVMFRR